MHILRELDHGEEYSRIAELLERVPPERTCAVLYRTGYTGIGLGWTLRRRGIPFFSRETRLGYSGDTITRDVEADALAVARSRQSELPGWAARHRKKKER